QMRTDLPRKDTLNIHVTFLPYIGATGELKTKPTQHSVRELRGLGIQPHVIIARTDHPVTPEIVSKISRFCDVDEQAVVPLVTANNIYAVPLFLEETGLGEYIMQRLELEPRQTPDLKDWHTMVEKMQSATEVVRIGIVGKYIELHDAYMSVKESLVHAATALDKKLEVHWIQSDDLEKGRILERLGDVDGVVVPGGFGYRGVEGKILAARYCRENKVPYLGLCLGMQVMCVEFARQVLQYEDANSTEFNEGTPYPVINLMLEQRGIRDLGGTMRLGEYPCELQPGTLAARVYAGDHTVGERHRHRFEFNNEYRQSFQDNGTAMSGLSPDGLLVEIAEVIDHPYMIGSQFHPEFLSRPNKPHPLFKGLIEAAIAHQNQHNNN
ncbi:MAG: CTP synthase, partial [Anaerolineae bacterium]|nr:CTP synthase [Anaerolineae bacterium]